MKTIPLGNTHAKVSQICLGTMYFGSTITQDTAYAILNEYIQAGGYFFDTANKYASWIDGCAGGESEALIGRWMKERHYRDKVFIATKVGLPMPGVKKGLKASQIIAECEHSLQRLGTDSIDLYYSHADDRDTPLEETLEAFNRLVRDGKARFLGASNYLAWLMHHQNLQVIPVTGVSRIEQLQENLAAIHISLSEEQINSCQLLRNRAKITPPFFIPSCRHLQPLLTREILDIESHCLRFRSIGATESDNKLCDKCSSYLCAAPNLRRNRDADVEFQLQLDRIHFYSVSQYTHCRIPARPDDLRGTYTSACPPGCPVATGSSASIAGGGLDPGAILEWYDGSRQSNRRYLVY